MLYNKSDAEDLFIKGLVEFNNKNFYNAHEYWEDLWIKHKLEHPLLIQGLIQFSVGYFHLSNLNRKGAISLFNKSLQKLDKFKEFKDLKIDINSIVSDCNRLLFWLESNHDLSKFSDSNFSKIEFSKKQ